MGGDPDRMRILRLGSRLAIVGLVIAVAYLSTLSPIGLAGLLSLPYAVTGAILIIRRPRNSIGWLLMGVALGFALISVPVTGTPQEFIDGSVDLPVALFAVIHAGLGTTTFLVMTVLVMVFPSGRLPAGRWGRLSRLGLGVSLVFGAAAYLLPEISLPVGAWVRNPVALLPDSAIWRVINPATVIVPIMFVMLAGAVSMVVRARRATDTERQQLRWIAASFAVLMAAVGSGFAMSLFVPETGYGLAWVPAMVALPTVPIAVGIAVLRYRLYEIDRIISRTIGYAVLTAVLAAVFLATNLGLQSWVATMTGGGGTVAVAASTLLVAALFQPLRRRIQRPIDLRFNRAQINGERTLAAFGDRVREEVDLANLSGAVLVTADEAVRPAAAGLWLR
jgi:MFS family permease